MKKIKWFKERVWPTTEDYCGYFAVILLTGRWTWKWEIWRATKTAKVKEEGTYLTQSDAKEAAETALYNLVPNSVEFMTED